YGGFSREFYRAVGLGSTRMYSSRGFDGTVAAATPASERVRTEYYIEPVEILKEVSCTNLYSCKQDNPILAIIIYPTREPPAAQDRKSGLLAYRWLLIPFVTHCPSRSNSTHCPKMGSSFMFLTTCLSWPRALGR